MRRAILFDLDGVLIETEWETFVFYKNYLREHYGIDLPDDGFQYKVGRKSVDFWKNVLSEDQRNIVNTEKLTALKRELFNAHPERYIKEVAGGKELIESVKKMGWKVALTTQNEERMMQTVLSWLQMSDLFDLKLSLKDIARKKPDPEIYLKAAKILQAVPRECIVIEDSKDGIMSAKNAGMYCIAIRHPYVPFDSVRKADLSVSAFCEITIEMLAGIQGRIKKTDS